MWYTYYFSKKDEIIGRLPIFTDGDEKEALEVAKRNFSGYCEFKGLEEEKYKICRLTVGYPED